MREEEIAEILEGTEAKFPDRGDTKIVAPKTKL
jgi:hypothetical protein